MESEQNYPLTKRNNNLNNKKYDSKCKKELLRSSLQPNHEVEDCQEYSWFNNEQGKINQLWKDKNLEDTIFCCFLYPTLPPPSTLPFVSYIIPSTIPFETRLPPSQKCHLYALYLSKPLFKGIVSLISRGPPFEDLQWYPWKPCLIKF